MSKSRLNTDIGIGYANWRKTKRSKPERVYIVSVKHRFGRDEFTVATVRRGDGSEVIDVPGTQLESVDR